MGKNIIVMKMFKLQKWKPTLLQVLPSNITTFLKKEWKKILSQVTSLDFKCHDIVVKEAVHKWRQQFFVKLWNPCRAPPAYPMSPLLSMCYQFSPQILTPFSLRINTPCASVLGIVESPKLLQELFNLLDTKPDFHSA